MANQKQDPLTYTEASQELERILAEIESGDADVDVLSEKVERAAELIHFCRDMLARTELRVKKVVHDLVAEEECGDRGVEE